MTGSLYISYDGLLEPLGQSQVLPYIRLLSAGGIRFCVLTFEKPADLASRTRVKRLTRELADQHIRWVPLRYHKSPSLLATVWDVAHGSLRAMWLVVREDLQVIHARSYVSALIAAVVKAFTGRRFIFDMRGFWPEERVEAGLWPRDGYLYRLAKRFESILLRRSDAVVVLTRGAQGVLSHDWYRRYLRPETPVLVVPCCTDVTRFAAAAAKAPQPPLIHNEWLVHLGSVGTWNMLDEMLQFFIVARQTTPIGLLMLNRGEHDRIESLARRTGISPSEMTVRAVQFDEVPQYLAGGAAGLYFSKRGFSQLGSSPTKLAEYLAAGLPVVATAGAGEAAELIRQHRLGVVLEEFSVQEYRQKWIELQSLLASDPDLRNRCREVASQQFSLEYGASQYRQVYERLQADPPSLQRAAY